MRPVPQQALSKEPAGRANALGLALAEYLLWARHSVRRGSMNFTKCVPLRGFSHLKGERQTQHCL